METIIALLASLFSMGVIVIPICGFAIIFFGVLGLMVWLVRKRLTPPTQQETDQALTRANTWVDEKVQALGDWQDASLDDLSARWQGSWSHMVRVEAKGTIRSLVEEVDLVAFYLFRSAQKAHIIAATSVQRWQIEVEKGLARIYLDKKSFGQLRLSDGEFFDEMGQSIGQAKRKSGLDFFINDIPVNQHDRFYEVILRNRPIGAINNAPESVDIIQAIRGPSNPALIHTAGMLLDAEAVDWLLALAIIETVYYSVAERMAARRRARRI